MGFFSGPSQKLQSYATLDPMQQGWYQNLSKWLSGSVGKPLADLGSWEDWARTSWRRYANVAKREFQETTLPGIREAYAGQGALYGGARHKAELQAGSNLAENLGAARFDYLQKALNAYVQTRPEMNPAIQYLLSALQIPTSGYWMQNQPAGLGYSILGGAAQGAGELGGLLAASALLDRNTAGTGALGAWQRQLRPGETLSDFGLSY